MFQCSEDYSVKPGVSVMSIVYESELGPSNINGARRDASGTYVSPWRMNVNGQEALCG